MASEGRVVTLNTSNYRSPPQCCSCGAPQEQQLQTSASQKRGNTTTTLRMQFPYCNACAARVKDFSRKRGLALLAALVISVAVAGIVFAVTAIPLVLALIFAVIVGIGGAVGAAIALRPPEPSTPATSRGEAARITSFKDGNATIYCSNAGWGDAFANANGVLSKAKSKGDGFLVGAIVMAVMVAPAGAVVAWEFAHPTVYVDNPTAESLQIYVDGAKVAVVGPNANIHFDVGRGNRTFGWSKADAASPTATSAGVVGSNDAHLYNPNKSACYWLVADAYGSATVDGVTRGAQPIQEFYRFDKVDTWFGENPQSIEVSHGASGGTRVALQRSKSCMEFVDHGCSLASREMLVTCQHAATTEADFEACFAKGEAACKAAGGGGDGGVAAAARTTPLLLPRASPGAVKPSSKKK